MPLPLEVAVYIEDVRSRKGAVVACEVEEALDGFAVPEIDYLADELEQARKTICFADAWFHDMRVVPAHEAHCGAQIEEGSSGLAATGGTEGEGDA